MENRYEIRRVSNIEWEKYADQAHFVAFGETNRSRLDRIDFCILVVCKGEVGGYITCKEMDSETCYIQYGAVFPNFAKSVYVSPGYLEMIRHLTDRYQNVTTKVENTNFPMLKLAMKAGFTVVGTSKFKDKLFLDLYLGRNL